MALILNAVMEILRRPTFGGIVSELAIFSAPLWAAVLIGLLVGWAWKPRWAAVLVGEGKEISDEMYEVKPAEKSDGFGLQLALSKLDSLMAQLPSCISCLVADQRFAKEEKAIDLGPQPEENEILAVTYEDLEHLSDLVETTDGGPAWIEMMDKTMPTMSYKAWRRDPEKGPPQYRSRSAFEDATPEIVRDFFWDDEFRIKNKWDDMLLYHETLKECPATGTMLVHWVRKFPFFCSDREYTIGRRIWKVDGAYYCVTKGVPYPSLPRQSKPRRVDLYYSSWCIRAVESQRGNGQKTACEVLLFHHEDMGIPWEIAKLGVRQGMWGCVKRIEPGLRAYQTARSSGQPPSGCAAMAQINVKVDSSYLMLRGTSKHTSDGIVEEQERKPLVSNIPKLLIIGGAVALTFSLDHGLLTKAIIFGVARRFGRMAKRL